MSIDIPTRIPVILLTGFLGAGKTTLLLRWLQESPATGLRLGVVMNEFGQESVDSQIIDRPGLSVQQVSGGCVCCAPENELDRAIRQLAASGDCDYLVIETSGLADPDSVIDILTDADLLKMSRLQAVVTVVDGPWYAGKSNGEVGDRVLARRQIEFAQVVCISKCDRIEPDEIDRIETAIQQVNPRAECVRLPFGLPEIGTLLRRLPSEEQLDLETPLQKVDKEVPHLHASYQSVTWRFPVPVERQAFETFLTRLDPKEVVRAKGFVRFTRSPGRIHLFQTLWGHHLIEEFHGKPEPDSVAVLIGPNLNPERHKASLRGLIAGSNSLRLSVREGSGLIQTPT